MPETVAALVRRRRAGSERLGTTADAEEIRDTAVTQPLVVATALLARAALPGPVGDAAARRPTWSSPGTRVGELAAAAMAGVLTAGGGGRARRRPRAGRWPPPARWTPTGMAAVLGGDAR